jgi:acetone carboxylase gamma subunit
VKRRITEYLDVDLDVSEWQCNRCGASLGPASQNYKKGCLIAQRSPEEIWRPLVDGPVTFSFHPGWCRIVEFYCPGCGGMLEVEMLPPGHPITHDIELELDALRARAGAEQAEEQAEVGA